jgi:chromosome segregation ATPase
MELCGQRENALNGKMVELRIKMEQEYVQQLNEKSDELQRAMERLAEAAQATAEAEAKLHMIENDPDKMVAADQSKRIHDLQKKLADAEKAHRLEIKSLQNQHNRAMGEMSNERDALKKANSQFEKELDGQQDWEAQIHSLSEDVNFWKGECEKLQQSLHTQKELHRCIAEQEALLKGQERLVGTLRQQISRIGDQLARKDEEYESLLGLKVALDMEIKSYRWLLENEENRLGISSKKRKTASSSSSSSSSSSVTNGGSSQSSSTYNSTYTSKRTSASSTSGGGSSFEEIDANHDGVIDRSEWNNAVSKKQIRP